MIGVLTVAPDTRPEAGAGHVARCLALAEAWIHAGGTATTDLSALPPSWAARYRTVGVSPVGAGRPDWLVVDDYRATQHVQHDLRRATGRLAVVDDHGSLAPYDSDLVIDQNIGARSHESVQSITGSRFVMLRSEFSVKRDLPGRPGATSRPRRVLLSVGGSPDDRTISFVDQLTDRLVENGFEVGRLAGTTDVAQEMEAADLAFAASGSSAYELAAMGTPAILVSVAENQEPVGRRLDRAGVARYLGRIAEVEPDAAAAAVTELANDSSAIEAMSRNGRHLIDARGARRVVVRLRAHDVVLRDASADDAERLWTWANEASVRASAFDTRTIEWHSHLEWLADRLASTSCVFLLASDDAGPFGQIRFDIEADGTASIDYSVVADRRGRGLGAVLLAAGTAELQRRHEGIRAVGRVRVANEASVASFDLAGFSRWPTGSDEGPDTLRFTSAESVE